MNKVEEAKQILKDAGYYVEDLWQVSDVRSCLDFMDDIDPGFEIDTETAYGILCDVLTSSRVMEEIGDALSIEVEKLISHE